jgi:hypothetical protein
MLPSLRSLFQTLRLSGLITIIGLVLVSCGPSTEQTGPPTNPYDRAKDAFKSGELDRALEFTDKLATATPPGDFTERARVLRAVIYAGEIKSKMELVAAYGKGVDNAKNPQFKANYRRLQSENLQSATHATLDLAEVAHEIAPDGVIAKELTLEAGYPTTEGPVEVAALAKVKDGGWLEPDQQDSAAADSLRKGIDDALADAVSGDRAKARNALAGGSIKIDGASFAIFLSKELAEGAVAFNRHHGRDPQKLITICDEGEGTLKAAQAILKDQPDKDKEKEVKKLQEKFKTIRADK